MKHKQKHKQDLVLLDRSPTLSANIKQHKKLFDLLFPALGLSNGLSFTN